jgi:excisionase family DNA binding protein
MSSRVACLAIAFNRFANGSRGLEAHAWNGSGDCTERSQHVSEVRPVKREWLSIAEMASALGIAEMTLYRVIAAGQFPAVRIGRRLFIPAKVLDRMSDAALSTGRVVSAADFCGESS